VHGPRSLEILGDLRTGFIVLPRTETA
jgi:predicted RNase H-like nuclease